jgi:putative transcriptional regulator
MNRIRAIREQVGISQTDLYRRLGWKQSRLANYEAGNRMPGLSEAREIVAALNWLSAACTLEDVFPAESTSSGLQPMKAPTLEQTILANGHHAQSDESAVNLSSVRQDRV